MRLPPVSDGRDISGAGDAGRRSERVRQRKGRLKVLARKELKALAHQALGRWFWHIAVEKASRWGQLATLGGLC
jgi:hypothetical protein